MNTIKSATILGRALASYKPELRVESLATRIAGGVGRLVWRRSKGKLFVEVNAGGQAWALGVGTSTAADDAADKRLLLETMTVSLVHEVTNCTCSGTDWCPAYLAFSGGAEGRVAA